MPLMAGQGRQGDDPLMPQGRGLGDPAWRPGPWDRSLLSCRTLRLAQWHPLQAAGHNGSLSTLTAVGGKGEGSPGLLGSGVLGREASRNQGQGAWGCPPHAALQAGSPPQGHAPHPSRAPKAASAESGLPSLASGSPAGPEKSHLLSSVWWLADLHPARTSLRGRAQAASTLSGLLRVQSVTVGRGSAQERTFWAPAWPCGNPSSH